MIEEITQAIIKKIPTARLTWWREDNTWFFKMKVSESDIDFTFGTMAHALGPNFARMKADPFMRRAQALEIAQLVHCDYLAAKRQHTGADQNDIVLSFYALYDHPRDYPDKWIVRRWNVVEGSRYPQPETEAIVCESRKDARDHVQKLKPGAILITIDDPDPSIYEVWS